jgi:hypothetical protein
LLTPPLLLLLALWRPPRRLSLTKR